MKLTLSQRILARLGHSVALALLLVSVSMLSANDLGVELVSQKTSASQAKSTAVESKYPKRFKAYAYDLKSGELLYTENYSIEDIEGDSALGQEAHILLTDYLAPNGEIIAKRNIQYSNGLVAKFQFESIRSNFSITVDRRVNDLDYKRIDSKGEKSGTLAIKEPELSVIDAGFSGFIIRNWDALLQAPKSFKFFHTGKSRWLTLRVKSIGSGEIDGYAVEKFKLSLANRFFNAFIDPITLSYYSDIRVLSRYEGVSNIVSEKGAAQNVRVEFPRKD